MLLSKMTIADEIALVQGNGTSETTPPAVPYVFYTEPNTKLCIPGIGYEDGPAGVADYLTDVTQLPAGVAIAATFSKADAMQYGITLGAEQAAKGSGSDLGPTVNIMRDPRWGRNFESLSEDPALTAGIDVAEIQGMQTQRVMAQVKHFDAYNVEFNRNTQADDVIVNQRTLHEIYQPAFRAAIKDGGSASLMCAYSSVNGFYSCESHSLLTGVLRNELNFKGLVMSDYGAVHDVAAATAGTDVEQPENTYFGAPLQAAVQNGTIARAVLNSMVEPVLYEMFRFDFFQQSTAGHDLGGCDLGGARGRVERARRRRHGAAQEQRRHPAAQAQHQHRGDRARRLDPGHQCGQRQRLRHSEFGRLAARRHPGGRHRDGDLHAGFAERRRAHADPVPRALSAPYSGTPYGGSYTATLTAPETGTYAISIYDPCVHCYTLTQVTLNGTAIINHPDTPPVSTIAAAVTLTAGQKYTLAISGESSNLEWRTPSQLAADFAPAVAAAKAAKVAVVVVSDDTESEAADRPDLQLPSAQDALIEAVAAANPNTVVVVQAGAPVTMPWLSSVKGVLDTWYPGQTDGTALADVLYGVTNPGGHLPVTFPVSLADVPTASPAQFPGANNVVDYSEGLLVGYRWYDQQNIAPLFPFGYGLSYTSFKFSNLQIVNPSVDGVTPVKVSATITNTGKVSGSDAVQLYLGYPNAAGEPPRKLVDFNRVTLAPGASTKVSFTIKPSDEWWWNNNSWDESTGTYNVFVG